MMPVPSAPLALYYVRHGQTAWSLTGQHTGRTDLPLTAHGEDEARGLAPWLRHVDFSAVLTSPRQRAARTCELAGLGDGARTEPDLAEWDYGDYEGMRSSEIRQRRPNWSACRDGCPGGEMPADIATRADRLIARLDAMRGNVALFAHGEFGLAFAARWIGLPVAMAGHFIIGTASVAVLTYNPAHPEMRVIGLWNASPTRFDEGKRADRTVSAAFRRNDQSVTTAGGITGSLNQAAKQPNNVG